MNIIKPEFNFFKFIFLLSLLVFVFNGTSILPFSTNIAHIIIVCFLMALFIYLLLCRCLLQCFSYPLLIFYFLYIFWCIFTSFWANDPSLSLEKSIALGFTSLIFSSAGFEWVSRNGWKNAINWLLLIVFITIISALMGEFSNKSSYLLNSEVDLYTGVMGGCSANVFGFFCAISVPFLLWKSQHKKYFWHFFLYIDLFYLFRSGSRSAFLIALVVFVFWLLSLNIKRKITIVILSSLILLIVSFKFYSIFENFIFKGSQHTNVLQSRQSVWGMSYVAAKDGGWFGVGYGGFTSLKDSGLADVNNAWIYHSQDNSREKGNSQLASVEETGIIGLSLYCTFLLIFFIPAIKFWRRSTGQQKILFGIILGSLVGLLLESIFESWWSGPFSQETAFFWLLLGVARGLMIFIRKETLV